MNTKLQSIYGSWRNIELDKRGAAQLAKATIKNRPEIAIVELITNSNDSYNILEESSSKVDGRIFIEVIRQRDAAIYRIIDFAAGFSDIAMEERVGSYGKNTSGFTEGKNVRGFWGRGLKEAILGLGYGRIESIQNGMYYKCLLNTKDGFRLDPPREVTSLIREQLSIPKGNGTRIVLKSTNQGVKNPTYETLRRHLSRYYSLRGIMQNPKREILLVERNSSNKIKSGPDKLSYFSPKGQLVVDRTTTIKDFDSATVRIKIFRSDLPLDNKECGPFRESGLLVKSNTAIHDITLFKYDRFDDDIADHFFGSIECDYIDELIKQGDINGEFVTSDRRDGLDYNHKFSKAIAEIAETELKILIDKELKEREEKRKKYESQRLKKTLQKAIKKLNEIAKKELRSADVPGDGLGTELGKKPQEELPSDGFNFVPDYIHAVVEREATLTLKAFITQEFPLGSPVSISADSNPLDILNKKLIVTKEKVNNGLYVDQVKVIGKQVGDYPIVSAKFKELTTEATVRIVPERNLPQPKDPSKKGIFNEIILDDYIEPTRRSKYDVHTGNIVIATKAPSVKKYLGENHENQEELYFKVLLAELVSDAFCREIARRGIENGSYQLIGENYGEAVNIQTNKLVRSYAHLIHEFIMQ